MKYYFELQRIRLERFIRAFGLPPWAAVILSLILLAVITFILFIKTSFAALLLGFFGLSFCFALSEKYRNYFLLQTYHNKEYRLIRIIENGLVIIPFIIAMLVLGGFLEAFITLLIAVVFSFIKFRGFQGKAKQTIFSKNPFEYTVGVRQWGLLFIGSYILTAIAIYVGNFELGLFSLALIPITSLSFYSKPENYYFVWNYNSGTKEFLIDKIKVAMKYNLWIIFPILISLLIFDPIKAPWLLAVFLVGNLMLIAMILGKYTAYPQEVSVAQGILMGICFIVFPLLIILIPFLWKKANDQLSLQL